MGFLRTTEQQGKGCPHDSVDTGEPRHYPLDDMYCWVNGWYDLDREAAVNNYTYLSEAANPKPSPPMSKLCTLNHKHSILNPSKP